jgi:predicted lipoprotein with Yx(FWY)xxD motif
MKPSRRTIVTTTALTVAAAAAVGGVSLAATSGNSPMYSSASGTSSAMGPASATESGSVVRTAIATVQGTKEHILVNAKGYPLYTYRLDTTTTSHVAGQLAALWPPLVSKAAPARAGAGKLTTVATANGQQVAYNGHFLYTFVEDKPGQVTGQGVQDFYVATPDIIASSGSSPAPSPAPAGTGY